jgi:hypothetical protein
VSAVPNESHRLYWDGPPIWCALRPLARLFADAGAAIVGSTFCSEFALRGLDPDDPLESMAVAYTSIFDNRSEDFRTAYLAQQFEQYAVDAAIYHDCRTTPETSHVRYGPARIQHLTGAGCSDRTTCGCSRRNGCRSSLRIFSNGASNDASSRLAPGNARPRQGTDRWQNRS